MLLKRSFYCTVREKEESEREERSGNNFAGWTV
jgi:hypothetical protein